MIDTKLLRQKILDLAIRGKLVPQDPKDEPASELLKKIKAEKEALIKAGKLKRDKHESFIFRGDDKRYYEQVDGKTIDITGEIPFCLPAGWEWCRLHNIFSVVSARRVHKSDWKNAGIPFYRAREIARLSEAGVVDNELFISHEQYASFKKTSGVPCSGDLMVTAVGTIGKMYIVSEKDIFYYKDASVICFENRHHLIPEFFKDIFPSTFMQSQIYAKSTGSTVDTITIEKAEQYLLPLPPLAEQKRIAEQIESLLKCVDEIDRESATLEKTLALAKQKILDLAIRGKLVPQDPKDEPASELLKKIKAEKEALIKAGKMKRDKHESFIFRGDDNCYHENINGKITDITEEIPFDLPQGWTWCRMHNVARQITDGEHLTPKREINYSGYYLISARNVLNTGLDLSVVDYVSQETYELLAKRCSPQIGDILLSCSGTVGRCCICDVSNCVMVRSVALIAPLKMSSLYLQYAIQSLSVQKQIQKKQKQVAQANIFQAEIKALLLPLSPLAEQKRIVSQVEKLFSVLETMRG